ncbi:MAG: hypothetical protein FJZ56_01290 [Chlamydiae bacterium]|nr:hypothetical protein [Chlamydiota bacterium]
MQLLLLFFSLLLPFFLFAEIKLVFCDQKHPAFHPNLERVNQLLYAGESQRYSLTSGIIWSNDDHDLFSVHLYGSIFSCYSFDKSQRTLLAVKSMEPIAWEHPITGKIGRGTLLYPENLDIHPVTNQIAVSEGSGLIRLFTITKSQEMKEVKSLLPTRKGWLHGIAFSPSGRYLAATMIDSPSCVFIFDLAHKNYKKCHIIENTIEPLYPKGISFSCDETYLAICYADRVGLEENRFPRSEIHIHEFHQKKGEANEKPCSIFSLDGAGIETIKFHPSGSYLLFSDQVLHTIGYIDFDRKNGSLSNYKNLIEPGSFDITFPHGLACSHDKKYLAVSSYGNDSVTIFEIQEATEEAEIQEE